MTAGMDTALAEIASETAVASTPFLDPPAEVRAHLGHYETDTRARYPAPVSALMDWHGIARRCKDAQSLLTLLSLAGVKDVATRIAALGEHGAALDEDDVPASVEAIRALTLTIKTFLPLGEPLVGLSDAGSLVAEWHADYETHLAMKLYDDTRVTFALIKSRARLSGSGSRSAVIAAIRAYGMEQWMAHEV